jgi:hypothetical protein
MNIYPLINSLHNGWGLLLLSGCQIGMGPPSYIPERAIQPVAVATTSAGALKPPVRTPSSNPIPEPHLVIYTTLYGVAFYEF